MLLRIVCVCLLLLLTGSGGLAWQPAPPQSPASRFPVEGILPKAETGATRFLQAHPEFDGRGVIVAIFDTGVDPHAPGLQQTSTGQPKILDLIDATGSGDVPLTLEQEAKDGKLTGATGRTLNVNPQWRNPTGKYRLGMKAAYDLFPSELLPRLHREAKERLALEQRRLDAQLREQLGRIKAGEDKSLSEQECQARIEALAAAWEHYEDPGPVYDCVAFHDGQTHRAVIDTDQDGDLTDEQALASYRQERQFVSFGPESRVNFSVQFFDEGKLLSLVTACDEHGTHVAGIVAAYDAEHPEHNGLAPGAQIVSVKIGDTRLDGMETGAALIRALQVVLDHHCDLINMSYGEPTSTPNHGALVERFSELVREKGVIFVAAAGNDGPALSTVGAPGGTTSAVIGVGAYVSPAMMAAEYSLREIGPGLAYTWSSRGPTADGDWGVDLFAPGGAIAPVPNYALQPGRQMNGTSMASPNACGAIALLLSACKQTQQKFSPISVLRSLQATAERIPDADRFAQGPGLLQVDRAFEHHQHWGTALGQDVEIAVSIPGRGQARGIYLREPGDSDRVFEGDVKIEPLFAKGTDNALKLAFRVPVELHATADWIQVGGHLWLAHDADEIPVRVDPTKLPPGVHAAEILGTDAEHPQRGPLFRVPVIVARVEPLAGEAWRQSLSLTGGEIARRFLAVPEGARSAKLRVQRLEGNGERTLLIHALQLPPARNYEASEAQMHLKLSAGEVFEHEWPVLESRTLELCLAQYWSSPGETNLSVEVRFQGLSPSQPQLTLPGDGAPAALDVWSRLAVDKCEPRASLVSWEQMLAPHSHETRPLSLERDALWDQQRTHQLVLTYEFEQPEQGDATILCPELAGLLYDSPLDSFRLYVFDAHNQLVHADDTDADGCSLEKGTHTVKIELRDADHEQLKRYESLLLAVRRALPAPIAVPIDRTRPDSVAGKDFYHQADEMGRLPRVELAPGQSTTLFLKFPADAHVPEHIQSGDRLRGELFLTKSRVDPLPIVHNYMSAEAAGESAQGGATSPFNHKQAELQFRLQTLRSLTWPKQREDIEKLIAAVLEQQPENREVRVIRLHLLDNDDREERLPEIVAAADDVIRLIPQAELRTYFGTRHNPQTPEQKQLDKTRSEEKKDLIDALYRKGRAFGHMELPEVLKEHPIVDQPAHDAAFEQTFQELASWVDTTEQPYFLLHVRRDRKQGHLGQALRLLDRFIHETPDRKLYQEKRRDIYEQLGWNAWREIEQHWLWRRFPETAEPF